MSQQSLVSALLLGAAYSHSIMHRSYPSPEGTHHGRSDEYFRSVRSQPADSLKDRFSEHYAKVITNGKQNGYLSPDHGVPYHSVETLMVEAPDYGHETTSEAYSEYLWLTAVNIWASGGDTSDFEAAWTNLETYIIPSEQHQPTSTAYDPSSPAAYAPEENTPSDYPVTCDRNVQTGQDDLNDELAAVYGSGNKLSQFYATHWLLDVDNVYGFGQFESGSTSDRNVFVNSYQRGANESVWRTVPQPEWDAFKYGGKCGYLQLDLYDPEYACDEQWRYTGAPDADARTIQATYWAYNLSNGGVTEQVQKAVKLSDFIRYSMFDKYFKVVPCYSPNCPAVSFENGWNATFYLISWYMAWGGPITDTYWGFRIGSSHVHQGYQNAMAAYVLSTVPAFESKTTGGKGQWAGARYKTIDFWEWLQSEEGAIAGGATNSFNGQYGNPAEGGITGYFSNGMAYQWEPVYHDPPSNDWFGMQAWSQERNAEYCYLSGDGRACGIVKKWVSWIMSLQSKIILPDNDYAVPSNLAWTGQPDNYTGSPHSNSNLHVAVVDYSKDVGVASALAHALTFYAAQSGDSASQTMARELLDRIYMYADDIGVAVNESRQDYIGNEYGLGFWEPVYVPADLPNGQSVDFGQMPNGDAIKPGITFLDIRSWYKNDPSWPIVEQAKQNGVAPVFQYHRMWAQAEFGIATADYARLFGSNSSYYVGQEQDKDMYFEDAHYADRIHTE